MNSLSKRPLLAAVIAAACLVGVLIGFFFGQIYTASTYEQADTTSVSDVADTVLLERAFEALALIEAQDFKGLASYVHPTEGITLSPYATVDLKKDLHFSVSEVRNFGTDSTKYNWGIAQSSGKAIELTPSQYFQKLITDNDFLNAPIIGRNRIVGAGNTAENVSDAFPDSSYIEFHIPAANEIAWKSLKLVFQPYEEELKLVAIVCGEWAI